MLIMSAVAVPGARSQTSTTLRVQGHLTAQRIGAFGTLEPAADGKPIRVRLFMETSSGFEYITRTTVDLEPARDSDDDGVRESRFSASFPSPPTTRICKLVARFPGTRRRSPARRAVQLPCNRPDFPTGAARLHDVSGGRETTIDVEIANTDQLRAFGLMYKRRLAEDRGMAFQYSSPSSGGYWMKNTLIPLSIAFYDASGVILRIMDMEPCTPRQDRSEGCPSYDPETSYMGALEVNQGAFDRWNIDEGDLVFVDRG